MASDRQKTPDICSSDSSSVNSTVKRTNCNSATTQSAKTDCVHNNKRLKAAHHSNTTYCSIRFRTESEVPILIDDISSYTSEWTEDVLPCFRVRMEQTANDAYNVFSQGWLYFIRDQQKCGELMSLFGSRSEIDKIIADSYHHILQHVFAVHCDSVIELKMKDLVDAENNIINTEWIKNFAARGNQTKVIKKLCEDISEKLQAFIWQLMHMVRAVKSQNEISEGMYQELFILFCRVFDLHTVASSNVRKYTVDLGANKKIVAIPDAVIIHPTTAEEKICAVIQVKQNRADGIQSSRARSSNSCEERQSGDVEHEHIFSELRGQHVGQALCCLPSSVFGNRGIFGILVQETKVTISSFKADDTYFENLCNGLLKNKAQLTFSKEYNILRREGRLELLQTFLDLKKLLEYQSGKNYS